eukprot:TRINITY_DN665_c0_g1_i1.p1 TRINITY_DN665_c0_g1~~TRINITY_DN665_c0_g1_i1.p1  ORF type:complete len:155 (+),score=37.38 TRINITY_DN665_c0_g1_i1:180-644(+)
MASGVKLGDGVKSAFESEFKHGKKLLWMTFKLSDDLKEIVIDQVGPRRAPDAAKGLDEGRGELYAHFVAALPKEDGRYAVYDFDFTITEGNSSREANKIVFVSWTPEGTKLKHKMLYASSKDSLRKQLGQVVEVQATDAAEIHYDSVKGKCLLK